MSAQADREPDGMPSPFYRPTGLPLSKRHLQAPGNQILAQDIEDAGQQVDVPPGKPPHVTFPPPDGGPLSPPITVVEWHWLLFLAWVAGGVVGVLLVDVLGRAGAIAYVLVAGAFILFAQLAHLRGRRRA